MYCKRESIIPVCLPDNATKSSASNESVGMFFLTRSWLVFYDRPKLHMLPSKACFPLRRHKLTAKRCQLACLMATQPGSEQSYSRIAMAYVYRPLSLFVIR